MAILTSTTRTAAEDHLKPHLKEKSHQTSCELAEKMNCDQKNDSQSSSFNGLLKNWESGCLISLAKTTKKITFKLLLNILPAIKQHAVTNAFCTESSQEI